MDGWMDEWTETRENPPMLNHRSFVPWGPLPKKGYRFIDQQTDRKTDQQIN